MTLTFDLSAAALAQLRQQPDHVIFAVMVGCADHGNGHMDWDADGAFCHACERAA